MTPEQEADLVDRIARAMNPECFAPEVVATYGDLWALRQQDKQRHFARAALSIAKPIIRDEALRIASDICRGRALKWAKDEFHEDAKTAQRARTSYAEADRCAADIDALKSKGQKT